MRVSAKAWLVVLVLGVVFAAPLSLCLAAEGRPTLPLDGVWDFRLDPEAKGEPSHWEAAETRFTDKIRVPGAWDAQGFGAETDKYRHNFIGQAWYKREVMVPPEWAGRRVFLCLGGVHRYADVWVNGRHLGEHIGYLSPFEFELTPQAQPGRLATIAIRVDSKQRWDVDCLTGCFDIIDEMFANWGGIWGHVWLEARPGAWLEEPFVQPRLSPRGCTVSAKFAGDPAACDQLKLEAAGVEKSIAITPAAGALLTLEADLPEARLWSPEKPEVTTVALSLLKGGQMVDRLETRFGLREIRVEGEHFLLNGQRLFLRGYGDDAIYPETMAAPSDKEFYLARLRTIKNYGFNYVRHHSHMLPPEYYDAADEVGMLVSAEFPIAYMEYSRKAKGPARDLYESEWAAAITRLRNHPSIFDWSMTNEHWGSMPLAAPLYAAAKALDPTRPVIDSDGLHRRDYPDTPRDRKTIDYYAIQFDQNVIPLDNPRKHAINGTPKKPCLCHETGNYTTFPRLDAIAGFTHNFKPFWLTAARDKLTQLGLLEEAPLWARNSERLYLLCHKLNTEDLRRQPQISGYTWWLFQDYWTGSNGLVDAYFRPKEIRSEEVRAFNNDVVLLLDGLDVTAVGGQHADLKLLVSNYATEPLKDAAIEWQAKLGDEAVFTWTGTHAQLGQGEITELHTLNLEFPAVAGPRRLLVTSTLKAAGRSWANAWCTWVYPANPEPPRLAVPVYASGDVIDALGRFRPQFLPAEGALPAPAVYVVSQPNRRVIDAVAAGAAALVLEPAPLLPAIPNRFKTAWWLGNAGDCNTGTVVYDRACVKPIAPEGWCDAGWYHLLEGGRAALLEGLPAVPEVLVRGIDVHSQCRNKALLAQVKVGAGCLIISGLNLGLEEMQRRAEQVWILDRLVEYAAASPKPKAELPLDWLHTRAAQIALPEGPVLGGFDKLLSQDCEQTTHANYRGASGPMYVCRQLKTDQRVEWQTKLVPADFKGETICFRFAGGLGWKREPQTKGFALLVDGREVLTFDWTQERHVWRGAEANEQLLFIPARTDAEDALGQFYLTLPASAVKPGQACRVAVVSKGEGSRRWFGLTP